jgi:hypothetical protein
MGRLENNLIKEEWINGIVMMSPRPHYNHMEVEKVIGFRLENYFNSKCKVALENDNYKLKAEYNFLKEEIKSSRFQDLILDIRDIDLIEDDEDDI